jgi:hypothetical protein
VKPPGRPTWIRCVGRWPARSTAPSSVRTSSGRPARARLIVCSVRRGKSGNHSQGRGGERPRRPHDDVRSSAPDRSGGTD